jgi:hypothetical protein
MLDLKEKCRLYFPSNPDVLRGVALDRAKLPTTSMGSLKRKISAPCQFVSKIHVHHKMYV